MNYGRKRNAPALVKDTCSMVHIPRGFSLVEMLFYVAILSLSLLMIMQTLIVVMRSYGVFRAAQRIEREAGNALERVVREVRGAESINEAESTLGTHPGELSLVSTDSVGAPHTVDFYLDEGKLSLKENGAVTGLLTSAKSTITDLVFRKIDSAHSQGVKIEMTLQAGGGSEARTEHFYATAVLRNSY